MDSFVKLSINDMLSCINENNYKVNYPPHNQVKNEFEKFVNKEISDRRKNSSISDLRNFHNFIKRTLLVNVSSLYRSQNKNQEVNLLDIAVGRGGDLQKYQAGNIKNIFGFDKSRESIESINPFNQGAQTRYANLKDQLNINAEFAVGDAMQPSMELINQILQFMKNNGMNGFEIMSCQFAVHYFFQSEIALQNVFRAFSPLIKKGGYFVGTTVNGQKITDLLKSDGSFHSTLLSITKKYNAITPRKFYGNKYTFSINDTVDQGNYFNTMGESTEYLVNLKELKRVALEHGFTPVYLNFFEQIPGKKTFTTMSDFVSFEEIYNLPKHGNWKGKSLNQDEIVLNNLYSTFVFVKM